MTAKYFIPFNHQPVSYQKGTSATYTVPTGKYARITISYTLEIGVPTFPTNQFMTPIQFQSIHLDSTPVVEVFYLWIKEGQTLVIASNNTQASATSTISAAEQFFSFASSAGVDITIDASLWNTKFTYFPCWGTYQGNGFVTMQASAVGLSRFDWYAEEYTMPS